MTDPIAQAQAALSRGCLDESERAYHLAVVDAPREPMQPGLALHGVLTDGDGSVYKPTAPSPGSHEPGTGRTSRLGATSLEAQEQPCNQVKDLQNSIKQKPLVASDCVRLSPARDASGDDRDA